MRSAYVLGVLVLVLVLLAPVLAGCVGSSGDGDPAGGTAHPVEDADGDADAGGPDADGDAANSVTTLAYDAPNATRTIWSNDTFAPQDSCFTGGCITGDAWHTTDITEVVPADAPARVFVNVTYDTLPTYSPFSAWFATEGTTFYGFQSTFQPGTFEIQALMVRAEGGTVETVVQLNAPGPSMEPDPNTDYEMKVTAVPVPSRIDRGVPVEVELAPGQTIEARTAGQDAGEDEDEIAFRIYGPDDAAVDHVTSDNGSATWTVPDELPQGAYVIANSWTSDIELTTAGADAMRALTLDFAMSEPTMYEGTGTVTWDFDAARDPLWAGIYVQDSRIEFTNGVAATTGGFEATLTLPDGSTAGGAWSCTVCINAFPLFFDSSFWWGPGRADPGLLAGTYEAELTSEASAVWEYGHIVTHYVR